jgi:hypothetical protein
MMFTHSKTLRSLMAQKHTQKDFGLYLRTHRQQFHAIAAKVGTEPRPIAWSSGTLLLLVIILPNGSKSVARIYCKDAATLTNTLDKLINGEMLRVKLGFQLSRSLWTVVPLV